jgi:superfamily II DNA or RNA helicase
VGNFLTDGHPVSSRLVQEIGNHSSSAAKIELFRSLFRGRSDVYPRRFLSRKTGKGGYAPACANEWIAGVCDKPKVKCADCRNRKFLAVTDDVVRRHLSGQDERGREFVMGVYPMLADESCYFLAADFDGTRWQEDVGEFLETCRRLELPAALERSRSGNGGHIWLFFEDFVPASLARKLGAHILTETMERRPEIGLGSYDRFFPNQDTLPKGGFGNLIALPLQKRARELGNSVFLDDRLVPHADQWAYLASVRRIDRAGVEARVSEAEGRGRIVGVRMAALDDSDDTPWTAPPSRRRREPPIRETLPTRLELVVADQIYVPKENLPPALRNRLLRVAAFQNPEFYRAQAMRLPTYDKPRVIQCAEDASRHIGLPRGCLEETQCLLRDVGIETEIRDERARGIPLEIRFRGALRPEQEIAAQAILAHETGVLAATTAFGKTVVAAWLIAQRAVNALVLVHRQQLLAQWVERLAEFLEIAETSVGQLGGGRKKLTGKLDVALIQSLVRKGTVSDCVADYGYLVVDECHHLSAHSFELVARRARARFVTGLSATVTRKDGHHPIVFMQCGPVRHRVSAREQAASRPFLHQVLVRPTGFRMRDIGRSPAEATENPRDEFHRVYEALWRDERRSATIVADVVEAVRAGRSPLVLTERTEHLQHLAERLAVGGLSVIVLQGGMGKKALQGARDQLAAGDFSERVVVATGRFIGEGFDDPRLDTLFLTLPVSWRGTIAQYVGRLHRLCEGKRDVRVYDYADLDVPMLARMFDRRCRGYETLGYSVLLPASAIPGWPVDVPLPVDPQWKSDYAASVRRLVRDGVDSPLADFFVLTARPPLQDGVGATGRARSASEAFLFRRLETLPETSGRFGLNVELPIQFNDRGRMEVDFLCAEARVVIELDGPQHLDDVDAYRRDRRKDMLLQRNGYFVLRFLAEDVGKQLDQVLDSILAVLAHRSHGR